MQNYNTILGVIQMRHNQCSLRTIQERYHIGSSTVQLILKRFEASGYTLDELRAVEPSEIERLFYPPENLQKKAMPQPDFALYYDRIHAKGSKVNISYCWIEYKMEHPDGYEQSQFYELFNRFVEKNYGKKDVKMAVERVPGEKMYIDWVGDHPELITDPETGEQIKVHIFATTLGLSSLIYAEAFADEKLNQFITGTVNAIEFYGGVAKHFVPDNLRTAVTKHTKDELVLQSAYSDLEDFYDTIVLPPPARKPKGKATVEAHVRYLETHLVEKLKEKTYTSFEELNSAIQKRVADLNSRKFQTKSFSRMDAFMKYDKPCMKPLPGGKFTVCDYKIVTRIPDNYHVEYDNHYYSVVYTFCGKPAIIKATAYDVKICDQYNRLICKHKRAYKEFPKYITNDEHMKPEHLYYKEVNRRDGAYYRRWASVFGPNMSEFIDRLLKANKHEEQSFNACAGVLHSVKELPHGIVEETARECILMNSCRYKTFKRVLKKIQNEHNEHNEHSETLPEHSNIRGKGVYK